MTENETGTAIVFPGMSPSRFADFGRFLVANPYARELTRTADRVLGYPLVDRFRATEGEYSEYAQVAFMLTSLALARWACAEYEFEPDWTAGPSFGEKPLTAFTGALNVEDAVLLTARTARCLDEYFATEHRDVVTHSFVRTPRERLDPVLEDMRARDRWYEISCHVDQDFYMVSLHEADLDAFERAIRGIGGLPLYTMRPPMHAGVFDGLRRKAEREVLGGLEFADPRIPVVADQDGAIIRDGAGIRAMLLASYTEPLRWPSVVDALQRQGVGTVYVCGNDSLFGRIPVTTRAFRVVGVTPRLALLPRRRGALAAA